MRVGSLKPFKLRKSYGFTLIEVLIAVIVFAVGLLTVASLQGVARKANFEAVQRTTATHLSESLLERMRANPSGLSAYMGASAERELSQASPPTTAVTCNSVAAPCSPAQMADADLLEWWGLVVGSTELNAADESVGGLVAPIVCIRGRSDGASGGYEVAIAWRGSSAVLSPPPDDCGTDAPAYASPDGADDVFRRVGVVRTFISTL